MDDNFEPQDNEDADKWYLWYPPRSPHIEITPGLVIFVVLYAIAMFVFD